MATAAEAAGMTKEAFEAGKREIALDMLRTTHDLLKWDLSFNKNVGDLASILVERLKKNPEILESDGNLRDLLRGLRTQAERNAGTSGGDITGGDVWDEILKAIVGILTGEKELIVRIIEKIFDL